MVKNAVFSVITPSRGDRPLALAQAGHSLAAALDTAVSAGLMAWEQLEWLVGFDGVKGARPATRLAARFVDFPKRGHFGNPIRNALLQAAKGGRILLLDDDNALTPNALVSYLAHPDADMVIARIDTAIAFDVPFLPRPGATGEPKPGDIDPLCLCLARDLMLHRGRGWRDEGGYESDYLNIRRYHQRAAKVVRIDDVVGIYDAGQGLDPAGINPRQARRMSGPA